jgi:hypothetical protein
MHPINKEDVLDLLDITGLVVGTNPTTRRARERFFDAIDRLFFEGTLEISTIRNVLQHDDYVTTATLLEAAQGSDPIRNAAARRALRAIHETAFGQIDVCKGCERQSPFHPIAMRIHNTPDGDGDLLNPITVLGRIELILRAKRA